MYRNLLSVAGMTLLSRVTGFLRDVVLGAVLGAVLYIAVMWSYRAKADAAAATADAGVTIGA